jgi:hypothetical protein
VRPLVPQRPVPYLRYPLCFDPYQKLLRSQNKNATDCTDYTETVSEKDMGGGWTPPGCPKTKRSHINVLYIPNGVCDAVRKRIQFLALLSRGHARIGNSRETAETDVGGRATAIRG